MPSEIIDNPGPAEVRIKKGVVAGVLQLADVVPAPTSSVSPTGLIHTTVPSHLQSMYAESVADLKETEQHDLAELLIAYCDVFSRPWSHKLGAA